MNNITVFNIRSGFANNSSSTHSVIFFPPDQDISSILSKSDSSGEYGWGFFTVAGDDIKQYLRATLNSNLPYGMSSGYANAILNEWSGTNQHTDISSTCESYVDHQSCITLPLVFNGNGIDKRFFDSVASILLQPNVVIVGGNDNDDESHHLLGNDGVPEFDISQLFRTDSSATISKYDSANDYWTLFDRRTGNKTRLMFNQYSTIKTIPTKASTPDLVDIKLTDYCETNCSFCYQGSTINGKHASLDEISNVISVLSRNEVFEIAYGGGEPTTHPQFIEILQKTKDNHIVPNFTTKNLNWINENIAKIHNIIGSFAYSINHGTEVKRIAIIRDYHNLPNTKCVVQYVMGTGTMNNMLHIIEECAKHHVPLTLLGFKDIERGATFRRQPYTGWLTAVRDLLTEKELYIRLGVDTALIQQSQDELDELKIPKFLYHKDEGMFSWYIDAVQKKQGSSSYHEVKPYNYISSDFNTAYAAHQ